MIRMGLDFAMPAPFCGSHEPDTRPAILKDVHFLHFAIILSGVSIASTVLISLLTEPRPPEKVRNFLFLSASSSLAGTCGALIPWVRLQQPLPSLISLMVSVDVKHHVYLLLSACPDHQHLFARHCHQGWAHQVQSWPRNLSARLAWPF